MARGDQATTQAAICYRYGSRRQELSRGVAAGIRITRCPIHYVWGHELRLCAVGSICRESSSCSLPIWRLRQPATSLRPKDAHGEPARAPVSRARLRRQRLVPPFGVCDAPFNFVLVVEVCAECLAQQIGMPQEKPSLQPLDRGLDQPGLVLFKEGI